MKKFFLQIDPLLSSYTVNDLKPFSTYKFRMQAVNDLGSSGWSKESNITQTLPSAPSVSVEEVKVTPVSRTNVHLVRIFLVNNLNKKLLFGDFL